MLIPKGALSEFTLLFILSVRSHGQVAMASIGVIFQAPIRCVNIFLSAQWRMTWHRVIAHDFFFGHGHNDCGVTSAVTFSPCFLAALDQFHRTGGADMAKVKRAPVNSARAMSRLPLFFGRGRHARQPSSGKINPFISFGRLPPYFILASIMLTVFMAKPKGTAVIQRLRIKGNS